jgi:rod shape-determining protein MreC
MKSFSKKRIVKYLAVIGLLVFLYLFGLLSPLEKLITSFTNPVLKSFHSFSLNIRDTYNEQANKTNLKEENLKQEEELTKLRQENIKLKNLEEENEILRDYLGFLTRNNYLYIMGGVISRGEIGNISGQDEFLTIDRGKSDGLYPGLALIDSKGNLIGKVAEVKEKISKVFLINSKQCKLSASILNEEGTNGITQGELGLSIKMDFIPQSLNLKIGDLVLSSGLEGSIPKGLQIGKIFEINKESNELWQSAFIDPMADLNNISIVSVILPDFEISN